MKYASIDTETTGLDCHKNSVTEVAIVIDDLANPLPIDMLPAFTTYVKYTNDLSWNMFAMNMFKDRIDEYTKTDKTSNLDVIEKMMEFLTLHFGDIQESKHKITVAGKNFASFDREFLRELPYGHIFTNIIHHRTIDVGSMYMEREDILLPSLEECKKRAGIVGGVAHKALDDAKDVVRLIRHKYGICI